MNKFKKKLDDIVTIFSVIIYLIFAVPYIIYLIIKAYWNREEYIDDLKRNI